MKNFVKKAGCILALLSAFFIAGCGDSSSDFDVADGGDVIPPSNEIVGGRGIKGYLSEAIVFIDKNGNSKLDTGESNTKTDEKGNYEFNFTEEELAEIQKNEWPIVVLGGKDISTAVGTEGTASTFKGVLKAPAPQSSGAKFIVTPLTSLVQAVASKDNNTLEDAKTKVLNKLGIKLNEDILSIDPIADSQLNADSDAKAKALNLHKANEKLANIFKVASEAIVGASGSTDESSVFDSIVDSFADDVNLGGDSIALDENDSDDVLDSILTKASENLKLSDDAKNKINKVKEKLKSFVNNQAKAINDAEDNIIEMAAVVSIVEDNLSSIKTSASSGTDNAITVEIADKVDDKVKVVKENADVTGTKTTKGFALLGNKFNFDSLDSLGNFTIGEDSSFSESSTLIFSIVNHTGEALNATNVNITITAESSTDQRFIEAVLPVTLTASSAKKGLLSASVAKGASMLLDGTSSDGKSFEGKIVNASENASDIISSDSEGKISIDLGKYISIFKSKSAGTALEDFNLQGQFSLTVKFGSKIVVGYENATSDGLTNSFIGNKVVGSVYFN